MRVNIFRVGRWLTVALVAVWLAGCIRDFIFLEAWNADWLLILGMLAFTAAGVAVIIGMAWGIGWVVRRLLGVPRGRDFRSDNQAQVF